MASGERLVSLRFADGTLWDSNLLAEAARTISGDAENNELHGDWLDDHILGMGGNDGFSNRRSNGNNAGGRGRGAGDRPEAADKTATYTTKVQQQIGKGKAVFQGFTEPSKTVKGESKIDIQGELEAATASAADALSNQRIPKSVEKHIRSYYDQLNNGK